VVDAKRTLKKNHELTDVLYVSSPLTLLDCILDLFYFKEVEVILTETLIFGKILNTAATFQFGKTKLLIIEY